MAIGGQTQGAGAPEKKTYTPLSPGQYAVTLDRVNDKEGKTGSKYKELTFKVVEGADEGRLIFNTRFFSGGVSNKCIEISNEQADKLLRAMGESAGLDAIDHDLGNLENYIGRSVVAKVDTEYPEGYNARNVIKSFKRR